MHDVPDTVQGRVSGEGSSGAEAGAGSGAPARDVAQGRYAREIKHEREIYLAGGCFWGTEAFVKRLPGVRRCEVGYANGNGRVAEPTYEQVCSGATDCAECVRVAYDPSMISLSLLIRAYLTTIDPVNVNRQGGDAGRQYRTGIYWTDAADEPVVRGELAALAGTLARAGAGQVAVEAEPLRDFFPAEDYHQDYLDKNPGGYCHVDLGGATRFIEAHEFEFGAVAAAGRARLLDALELAMVEFDAGDPKRIQHFIKVRDFARLIACGEGASSGVLFTVEAAALVHDIGIHPAEARYGYQNGKLQEEMGPAAAREMLERLGFAPGVIRRVCYLVGHHHTYADIDGLDYQALVEADFLVNLYEDDASERAARTAYEKIFSTETGRALCRYLFLGQRYHVPLSHD